MTPVGDVTTLAGNTAFSGGIDGVGIGARFNGLGGLAVDASGNVYVSDSYSQTIRQVTPTGVVTTLVGTGSQNYQGLAVPSEGSGAGFGTTFPLNYPSGVALDNAGNLFVANSNSRTILKIALGGAISGATGSTLSFSGVTTPNAGVYEVVVSDGLFSVTSLPASLVVALPPSITVQPVAGAVALDGSLTLTVTATGTGDLSYQWFRNGTLVTGATSSSLVLTSVNTLTAGSYTVRITDSLGGVTNSAPTMVVVPDSLAITTQPQSQLFALGGSLSLSVQAVSSGSISYQWFNGGSLISGATASTYSKAVTNSADNGVYNVQLSSGTFSVVSNPASVFQRTPILALTPQIGTSALAGGSVTFSVSVLNGALLQQAQVPVTYAWTKDGTLLTDDSLLTGSTTSAITRRTLSVANAGIYEVTVTAGTYGFSKASAALQVVNVTILTDPVSRQVLAGGRVDLSVNAIAGGSLTYQWRKGGVAISGATSAMYSILAAQNSDVGGYDVVVTSGAAFAVSKVATVEILAPVVIDTAFFAKQARALNPNQALSLQVFVSGTQPLSFQWLKNAQIISGATLSSYGISSVQSGDAGAYSVLVSNPVSSLVNSGSVQISVNALPPAGTVAGTIGGGSVSSGSLAAVVPNSVVVLSATVPVGTDLSNLSYQWRRNGGPILNATASTYSLGAVATVSQEGLYDVVLTNTVGSVTWTGVQVSLSQRPVTLENDLSSLTVLSGSALKWTGFVAGPSTQVLTYVWIKGGTVVSTGTSNTLVINSVTVANAGTYTVTASNSFSSVTSSVARLNVIDGVAITTQPAGVTLNPGDLAGFAVTATGGSLNYQWLREGQAIAGATNRTFEMASVAASDTGTKLSVRVYNEDPLTQKVLSSLTSNPATLTVRTPVSITSITPSSAQFVDIGGSLTFSGSATGTAPLSYQWRKDKVAVVSGGTQATYTLSNATVAAQGSYDVVVKNLVNEVASNAVSLTVKVPVTITVQPVGRTANTGKAVTLVVAATGTEPITYQWYKDNLAIQSVVINGTLVSGTLASYSIPSLRDSDEGTYYAVVNNPAGVAARSNSASVFVNNDVSITTQPQSPMPVLLSGTVQSRSFSVGASTTGKTLRYQWRRNTLPISDAVSSTYAIPAVTLADKGDYDVQVSSGASTVTSNVATLDVFAALTTPTVSPALGYPAVSGGSATLTALSTSGGNLSYQWYSNRTGAVSGATGATLSVVPTDDLTKYSVQVGVQSGTLTLGTAVSSEVPVQLMQAVSIVSVPTDKTVDAGDTAIFSVSAIGGGTISYQWERKRVGRWESIVGAVTSSLTLSSVRQSDEGDYRVSVSNARNATVPVVLAVKLKVRDVDVITSQPVDQTVNPGDTAVFEVKANGVDLSYQWRLNRVAISGATSSVLSVGTVSASGKYDVLVTHAFGSSLSETARLDVRVPVTISLSPVSTGIEAGKTAVLLVKASGTEPLTYQWRKDNGNITGETTQKLTVAGSGVFDVVVSNAVGKVVSDPATVTVATPVSITVQPPLSTVGRPGDTVEFAVVATGTPVTGSSALAYQWYKQNGSKVLALNEEGRVSGTKTAKLTIAGVLAQTSEDDLGSAGNYYVEVKGQVNTVTSVASELSVVSPPSITKQPQKSVVTAPGVGRFSVTASGTPPFTYVWLKGGTSILNPTVEDSGAKLVLSGVTASQNGEIYSVIVGNASGQVTSGTAKLVVVATGSRGPAEVLPEPVRVQLVNAGTLYTFSSTGAGAVDGTKLAYQWRKDGVDIAMATSGSYTISSVSKTDAGVYDLRTSLLVDAPGGENDGGELSRSVGAGTLLVVNNGPVIEAMTAQSARLGQTVVFVPNVKVMDVTTKSLVAAPSTGVTYLWKKGASVLTSGSINSINSINSSTGALTIPSATASDAGAYSLQATYAGVTGEVSAVQLSVGAPISVAISSSSATLVPNLSGYLLQLPTRARMALEVAATNGGPFTYQWRFNGANIVGATASRFEIPSVLTAHLGLYDVVVAGAADRATSPSVTLALRPVLKITTQPLAKLVVNPGQRIELSVDVNPDASDSVTYQWLKGVGRSSQVVTSATSRVFTIASAVESDEASYSVVISGSNGLGRLVSAASKVTVNNPVLITSPLADVVQTTVPGTSVVFAQVKATGAPPLSYQWTRNGVNIPGANSDTFQISSVTLNDGGIYRAVVRNPVSIEGQVSPATTLVVSAPVTFVREPSDATVSAGTISGSLVSAMVQGDGILSYQWRWNGIPLVGVGVVSGTVTGGTISTIALTPTRNLTAYDTGYYDLLVTNSVNGVSVSRAVSRKANVQVTDSRAVSGGSFTYRANEGETVSLTSFIAGGTSTASWSLTGGTLDTSRVKVAAAGANLVVRGIVPGDKGKVYVASISSNGTPTGTVSWTLDVVPVPVINAEPVDIVVLPTKTGTLSAGLTITSDTRLQWYFQTNASAPWVAAPGATSAGTLSTYKVSAVTNRDAGYYRLEATNTAGTVSTRAAQLTVLQPVTVHAQMFTGGSLTGGTLLSGSLSNGVISGSGLDGVNEESTVNPGGTVSLVAMTTGDLNTAGNSFQWYKLTKSKVWTVIRGAVDPIISITNVKEIDDTYYRVRAFGQVNNAVDSAPIQLVVNDPVAFVPGQKLKTVALVAGESTTLSVSATGTAVQYLWYRHDLPDPVGEGPTFVISNATALSAGTYGAIIYNSFSKAGATASTPAVPSPATDEFPVARVTVQVPPVLSSISVVSGGTVATGNLASVAQGQVFDLRVSAATGATLPLTYQWRRNGVPMTATGASGRISSLPLTIPLAGGTANASSAGVYDVVVSNVWGSSVSTPVNVIVDLAPEITRHPESVTTADGSSATFRVEASGTGLSYLWYSAPTSTGTWTSTGVADPLLTLVNVGTLNSGTYYRAIVSKTLAGVVTTGTSNAAKLTVTTAGDIGITDVKFIGLIDGVALPGATLVASGTVTGSGALSYQWRKDGVVIAGTAAGTVQTGGTAPYTFGVSNETGGVYDLVVNNGANFAYSAPITLTVDPKIQSLEAPSTVNPGDGVRFQVKVASKYPLSYKWFKNGIVLSGTGNISGAASDTLILQSASLLDAGTYSVEISRTANSSIKVSRATSLAVTGLSITTQPVGITINEGTSGTLSVVATSATAYKWRKDGVAVSGGTSSTLTVPVTAPENGVYAAAGLYQVEVSNSGGSVLSNVVTVQVNPALGVTIDAPAQASVGASVNLVATARGTGPFNYQWTKNGSVVGTESRLLISPVTTVDAGTYTISVNAVAAPNVSVSASTVLSVRNVPEILVAPASQSVATGKTAKLFVVARFDGPLSYQWYLNGGTISGASARNKQYFVPESEVVSGGNYTVRVSSSVDATAFTEATARLLKSGTSSSTGTGFALGTVTSTPWWIYEVQGAGRYPVAGGTLTSRDTGSDRLGYWVVERITTAGVEKTGRSAWIWPSTLTQAVEWDALGQQQVQEVADTSRGEFSVVGSRDPMDTFVVSGRLEAGGVAAVYGAPDVISGEYDVEAVLDVDLSWDSVETLSQSGVTGVTAWETVKANLKAKLVPGARAESDSAPAGD